MASVMMPVEDLIQRYLPMVSVRYILCIFLLIQAVQRTRRWYKLWHIPGPPFAGWTSLWLTKRYLTRTVSQDVSALVDKYGPVVRIAPDKIARSDITTMYRITAARSPYRKSNWYKIMRISRHGDHILGLTDPELRKERKKYVMPAYTGRGVDFELGTDKALAEWFKLIDSKYLSTPDKASPMDFQEKVHFYALDAIGYLAHSQPLGCLRLDKDNHGVIAINDAIVPVMTALGNYLTVWKLLRIWPFYYLIPNDGDESGFGTIMGHANKLIDERLQPGATPKRDMLQCFIDHGLRGQALRQEVGLQFFAGSDTIASLLSSTFFLLLTNPPCYTRLQSELDAAFSQGKISTNASYPTIRDSEARALPYLQAIIREALRLFPLLSTPPVFKEVPPQGDVMCGYVVPGGTLVATGNVVWHGCREKGFWGEDGDWFRPERWLEETDGERLAQMKRRVELAFGSGQFVCIGRGIAMLEVGKVLAELGRRYNWSLADPPRVPEVQNNGVWKVHDFWVRVEKRGEPDEKKRKGCGVDETAASVCSN